MARTPVLTSTTLSPFGGGGGGFGSFSIVNPGREAYLTFLKVRIAWQNGTIGDDAYLAAYRTYVDAQAPGSSTRLEAEHSLQEQTDSIARNDLIAAISTGDKTAADLVAFDKARLDGLDQTSQEYLDRRNAYWSSENAVFNDAEKDVVQQYQDGSITAATLQGWYRDQAATFADNHDLVDAINKQITTLDGRILDERDSKAINDYSDGKMSDADFIAYAQSARARYVSGTSQASDWDQRIERAQQSATETGLLYRYGLSQQYAQLEQFVKSNAGKPAGGTSTSTKKRIVLGADGKWHTVTSTSTKATAPTAAEQDAYKKLQIQIADAKKQMAGIVAEIGATPDQGGWVSTSSVIAYYTGRQSSLVKGSADWYAMQQKIDSLNQQLHQETVLSQQGIKITYPGVSPAAAPAAPAAKAAAAPSSSVTLDSFMKAIASVESGGSYTARNAKSGAYGKYQIMPANWPAWAQKYLGSASAPQTPENQEKVVRAKMTDLYKSLGSWEAVAYWWHNGGSKAEATNPANYGKYVSNVMGNLGVRLPATSGTGAPGAGTKVSSTATGAGGPKIASSTNPLEGKVGGLTTVESIGQPARRSGSANLNLAPSSFPVNLDGQAFSKFYSNYEAAFNSGADSFTDTSTGKPITYFIGDDPAERADRMQKLDELRVGYYKERATAYAGTPSEIAAASDYDNAQKDAAGHYLRIMDTPVVGKAGRTGGSAVGANQPNVIASGLKVLDEVEASVKFHLGLAQDAYKRGDLTTAYAEMQLAQNAAAPVISPTGEPQGAIPALDRAAQRAQEMYAGFKASGLTPEQALGADAAKKWEADFARLQNGANDLRALLTGRGAISDPAFAKVVDDAETFATTVKSVIKLDAQGNAVKDQRTGEVMLDDGWARFLDSSGNVKIQQVPSSGVNPAGGGMDYTPKGYTKTTVKVGSTVETAYAPYHVDKVGYFKGSDGVNRPIYGKIVDVRIDGKLVHYVEDPLNPGHWSQVSESGAGAIVYNMPSNMKVIAGPDGNPIYQFSGKDNITYSLALDNATGTYTVIGNRAQGFNQSPIVNQPVGDPGAANVIALLNDNGITRDTATITGDSGFSDTPFPVFGMTPDQFRSYLQGPTPPTPKVSISPAQQAALAVRGVERVTTGRYTGKLLPTEIDRSAAPLTALQITALAERNQDVMTPAEQQAARTANLQREAAAPTGPATANPVTAPPKSTSTATKTIAPITQTARRPAAKPPVTKLAPLPPITTERVTTGRYAGKILPGG